MKHCSACAQDLPSDSFGRDKSRRDGLCDRCKPCTRLKNAASYQKNKESRNASDRAKYAALSDVGREHKRNQARDWASRNRERVNANSRQWKAANLDKAAAAAAMRALRAKWGEQYRIRVADYWRRYYAKNGAELRAKGRLQNKVHRLARQASTRSWRSRNRNRWRETVRRRRSTIVCVYPALEMIAKITQRFEVFGNRCAYCGCEGRLTIDHVKPVSKNGPHMPANIRPACRSCNSSKGNKSLLEWARQP